MERLSRRVEVHGQGFFSDKDSVAVVGKRTWLLRRDTDIDRLVGELVEAACRGRVTRGGLPG